MKLSDFDFDLPDDLIAVRPVRPRSSARLLVADASGERDLHVRDLVDVLSPGDRLVLNDTRVLEARLSGYRERPGSAQGEGRAKIEVTLLEPVENRSWRALVKPLRKLRDGETVVFENGLTAKMLTRESDGTALLEMSEGGDALEAVLSNIGAMPLPPYIAARRAADARDRGDYQTVFARRPGAVAAPTASLHFDPDLLAALASRGVEFTYVTLHVGAGTFLPVKVDDPTKHQMHSEWGEVTAQAAAEIAATKAAGGRVIPVGTTALRLLESAARQTGIVSAWSGHTDIFIYPGFQFRVADALMTNFHLPKSTLMMLVSALMGADRIQDIYAHAIEERYRFFSYGDSSLLFPEPPGSEKQGQVAD